MSYLKSLLVLATLFLVMPACSRTDATTEERGVDAAASHQPNAPFLAKGEIPEVEAFRIYDVKPRLPETVRRRVEAFMMSADEDSNIFVRLTNRAGKSVDNWIDGSPNETPGPKEIFYTTACGKEILVVVLRSGVNNLATVGKIYFNALFDPVTGEWITTFLGAETRDADTSEIISDDQKALLAKLKAGITHHCPEVLDYDSTGKPEEWLLQ